MTHQGNCQHAMRHLQKCPADAKHLSNVSWGPNACWFCWPRRCCLLCPWLCQSAPSSAQRLSVGSKEHFKLVWLWICMAPKQPRRWSRHACTYPTWHIPWLWNKLQETSLQGGQSMAHSIALWNINMLLIRSWYLMMLYDISWYSIIIFEMFVLKILFPWMCFRTCLKVPRPFGLSLNKQFPTNIKHLGSASGKRTSTMSAKGVTAETWDCVPVLGMPLGSLSTIAKHQNVCHLTGENQDIKKRNGLKHTCSNILCSHDT